jgi:GTPase
VKIAVVGKTNVGKSTIINVLTGKKFNLTKDTPGVTRNRKEVMAEVLGVHVVFIDTAGLERVTGRIDPSLIKNSDINNEKFEIEMHRQMFEQAVIAIKQSDMILFVVDSTTGLTEQDFHFADFVKKQHKKTILLVNKAEKKWEMNITEKEVHRLGLGEAILVSAEHNIGLIDVKAEILSHYKTNVETFGEYQELCKSTDYTSFIHLCILGRPNVGKSTLFNEILKEQRSIVGDKSGITRDAIATYTKFYDRGVKLIDTAGLKQNMKADAMEKASNLESMRALRLTHIAIVVVDATLGIIGQDLQIITQVAREGRPMIIALNKVDLLKEDKSAMITAIRQKIENACVEVVNPVIVEISAKDGKNVGALYAKVIKLYDSWNAKIQTAALNQWLSKRVAMHSPPKFRGKDTKLKYITQVKIRPPTFVIFANTKDIHTSYLRYLRNSIAKDFQLESIPMRFRIETSKNPFAGKKPEESERKGRKPTKSLRKKTTKN